VLRLYVGTALEGLGGRFEPVESLQRDPLIEKSLTMERVDRKGFLEAVQRFFGLAQTIQRDATVDNGFGVERIMLQRAVVGVKRFLVVAEVVQHNAPAHPRV